MGLARLTLDDDDDDDDDSTTGVIGGGGVRVVGEVVGGEEVEGNVGDWFIASLARRSA